MLNDHELQKTLFSVGTLTEIFIFCYEICNKVVQSLLTNNKNVQNGEISKFWSYQ